jgi:hypothetical protein
MLALAICIFGTQLVSVPLAFISSAVQFLWQAIAFTHAE